MSLSDREHGALLNALRAPVLWPLCILAGEVGIERALEACRTRELPPEAADTLDVLGYRASDLPKWSEARHLIAGVRVKVALVDLEAPEPLQRTARRLGLTLREAQKGLKTLDRLGARVGDYTVTDGYVRTDDHERLRHPG